MTGHANDATGRPATEVPAAQAGEGGERKNLTLHYHGHWPRPHPDNRLLAVRDLMDMQIETADQVDIGRVDDVEALIEEGGELRLTALLAGPQALAGRVSSRLQPIARRLLRDRFDTRIPIEEIAELGLVIKLRQPAEAYRLGGSERTLARILARIPGARRTRGPSEGL